MEELDLSGEKLKLKYPCKWVYKVICEDKAKLMESLEKIFSETKEYLTDESNTSRTGKYISMNVTIIVESEEDRKEYFEKLQADPAVKMVL